MITVVPDKLSPGCRPQVLGVLATWRLGQQGAVRSNAALHHQHCGWQGWGAAPVPQEPGPDAG